MDYRKRAKHIFRDADSFESWFLLKNEGLIYGRKTDRETKNIS